MKSALLVFILFLFVSSVHANQCPKEAKCETISDEEVAYIAATMVAAKNVCSRLDPVNTDDYAAAIDLIVDNERADYEKALKLKELPTALKYIEEALNSKSIEKVKDQCSALLKKLK